MIKLSITLLFASLLTISCSQDSSTSMQTADANIILDNISLNIEETTDAENEVSYTRGFGGCKHHE